MADNGDWGATLSPGDTVPIPAGKHSGAGQVYARPLKFLDLGVGQNFNVAARFPGYRNLTVDNFVVYSVSMAHTGNSAWHHIERMNKSYNAATGQFNCSVVLGEYSDALAGRQTTHTRVWALKSCIKGEVKPWQNQSQSMS